MAHKLEQFYSSFGGVDTRSNKLLMDPKTYRNGSKNFRYNFQDEIQNANGWQHKTENTPVSFVDIFEYKFRDVNSGESKSQVLAVGVDGNLYRKLKNSLKWITHGTATSYSFYYDEVGDTFKLDVNGVGSVTVSDSMTLAQLKTALNALAGVSVDIVDSDGVAVVSSKLAYLLDVRIEDNFNLNSSWYWEVVPHPNIRSTTGTNGAFSTYQVVETPFQVTVKAQNSATYPEIAANYEGISSISLNNCIYITDGGFPHKYDGKTVYRAGMPKQTDAPALGQLVGLPSKTGMTYTRVATPTGLTSLAVGSYKYLARIGFTDFNGATCYGSYLDENPLISPGPIGATEVMKIDTKGIYYGQDFPTFCAKVNGDQATGVAGGGVTVTVHTGHNILPGMIVRQITTTGALGLSTKSTSNSFINFYARVTAVTETTITLQETVDSGASWSSGFYNNDILQAYFTADYYINNRPYSRTENPPGAFIEVYRTKVNATSGPFYLITKMPVPHRQGDVATIYDTKTDTELTEAFGDQELGGELPRACKYLTKWQSVLVQAGIPADTSLKDQRYPSVSDPTVITAYSQPSLDPDEFYTEAFMADAQSVYWADLAAPEGFPQDGLNEFLVDTLFNDEIKGIAQNKDALFALKERSTGVLTGELGVNEIVLEVLEDDIGLASHKTIQDVKGSLFWLDPDKGFYSCVAGRLPVHVGYPIADYQEINSQKLDYSTAAAMTARGIDMYICAVGTTWFVFDFSETSQQGSYRNCWYIWERFAARSALFTADSDILLLGDRVWEMKVTNTRFDMTDHKSAIEFNPRSAWLNFGTPTIDKKFERVWTNSIQGGFSVAIDQYGNYSDVLLGSLTINFTEQPKLTVKQDTKCKVDKLSAVSIGFRNAEKNKLVRIQGWELEYAPDFDPQEPKR